jgi:predicted RNA-binding Zn-ribbon protein involved in translation (DUF1610 family)
VDYCCEKMDYFSTLNCKDHSNIYECPDVLISSQSQNNYGLIIHDGGSSKIEIQYCPWCGTKLEN